MTFARFAAGERFFLTESVLAKGRIEAVRFHLRTAWLLVAVATTACATAAWGQPAGDPRDGLGPGRGAPAANGSPKKIDGPSIVKGKPAGIEVGQYPPDFELQPIEAYPKLCEWLGDVAPRSAEDKVKLSQLVGKQPILLLYGSYT